MSKVIPPLVEGPRKGGRNPVRENFVRPDPPAALRAKQDIEAIRQGFTESTPTVLELLAKNMQIKAENERWRKLIGNIIWVCNGTKNAETVEEILKIIRNAGVTLE